MKRLILILLLFWVTAHAQTGLPYHKNRTALLGEYIAVRDSIVKYQNIYFKKHGRYFQGLPSDTTVRDISGTLKRFDRTVRPADKKESWLDFGLYDCSVRGTWWIDVYDGPAGKGFVLNVAVKYDTLTYRYSRNYGPSSWMVVKDEFSILSKPMKRSMSVIDLKRSE